MHPLRKLGETRNPRRSSPRRSRQSLTALLLEALPASVRQLVRIEVARPALAVIAGLALLGPALSRPAAAQNDPPGDSQDPEPATPQMVVEGDEIVFSMSETSGMDLKDFIKWAQEMTQKRFTFNENDLTQALNNRVSFLGTFRFKQETFAEDFFGFFQTMLYIKGFALLQRGSGDTELLGIVNMGGQRGREVNSSARYVSVDMIDRYKNQTGVPIITTVRLKNMNATIAQNALRPFFAAAGGAAAGGGGLTINAVGNNSSLLVQGFGPQVHDFVSLFKIIDQPTETPNLITQVVRLEYAAPEELFEVVNEILENRQQVRQQALQETQAGGAQSQLARSAIKIVVTAALRALVLSGTAEQVREALELIARLDVPSEPFDAQASVIALKNVLADDLRQTLNQFVVEDQQAEQQAQQQAGQGGARARPRRTVIQAHPESNSLLVSASATKYKQIVALIDELDRRQPQVLIECALVELTTGDLERLGVELGLVDLAENGDFTRGFGFTNFGQSVFEDTDDDGIPDTRLPDFENPLQGLTGGIISGGDFAVPVLLAALASDQRANILSMPSILVNNNTEATVITEEERPTLETASTNTSTTQSAGGNRNAGITMNISPTISRNNYLRLNISLEVSRFVGAFDPNSPTGGGIVLRRNIQTQVTMPSGDTMVLGGVIDDQESYSEGGVPYLKDLPLLGFLFRSSESTSNKTNLYFFVSPTILDEDDFDDLWQLSLQKKMEAERYIGTRRLRVMDRKWTGANQSRARVLEDSGTTIEDLDAQAENELPYYHRPDRTPAKPAGPSTPTTNSGQ